MGNGFSNDKYLDLYIESGSMSFE